MILFEAVAAFAVQVAGVIWETLLEAFLSSFLQWVATLPALLFTVITGKLIGAKTFVDTANDEEISDNYALRSDGQWELTTLSRHIRHDEIPEEYRNMGRGKIDITDELEMTLQ